MGSELLNITYNKEFYDKMHRKNLEIIDNFVRAFGIDQVISDSSIPKVVNQQEVDCKQFIPEEAGHEEIVNQEIDCEQDIEVQDEDELEQEEEDSQSEEVQSQASGQDDEELLVQEEIQEEVHEEIQEDDIAGGLVHQTNNTGTNLVNRLNNGTIQEIRHHMRRVERNTVILPTIRVVREEHRDLVRALHNDQGIFVVEAQQGVPNENNLTLMTNVNSVSFIDSESIAKTNQLKNFEGPAHLQNLDLKNCHTYEDFQKLIPDSIPDIEYNNKEHNSEIPENDLELKNGDTNFIVNGFKKLFKMFY